VTLEAPRDGSAAAATASLRLSTIGGVSTLGGEEFGAGDCKTGEVASSGKAAGLLIAEASSAILGVI
jgi:hypothetical protein